MFKQGEHIYFAFLNGKAVLDRQRRPRMYRSRKHFESAAPQYLIESAELVKYVPEKQGEWEKYTKSQYLCFDTYQDVVIYSCSKCGRETIITTKFCPDCGAKMDLNKEKKK